MNSGADGAWRSMTPDDWSKTTQPCVAFQIWYSDGSCVTGGPDPTHLQKTWLNSRHTGVQVLMVHHLDGYRTIFVARDEYTWPGLVPSKLGEAIDLQEYRRIRALAMSDEWRP